MQTSKRLKKEPGRLRELWSWWVENMKAWGRYLRGLRVTALRIRWADVKKQLGSLRGLREKLKHLSAQRGAHKFPESEYAAVQLFLFFIGSLPKLGAGLSERVLRRHKLRVHRGGRLRALFEKLRHHRVALLAGGAAIAAVVALCCVYTIGIRFSYDGTELGTVSNRRIVKLAVEDLEKVTRETLGQEDYTIDRSLLQTGSAIVRRKELSTRAECENLLAEQLGCVSYGYVLYVNEEPVAATTFSGAMEELLEQLKEGYATADTVECYFEESVEIREEYTDAEKMMNLGYIAELLNDTKQGEITYTVKSGDVWSEIADSNGMTNKQLLALNPGYDISNIHIGDVLTITNAVPYLTVVNVERQNYIKNVPYKIEYQDDSSMYQGDFEVISAGEYGKADVTANVTYINGEETDREIVASALLCDPVTETQRRGTKERPSWFPTGTFRWPCSGGISSYFGYRDTGIPGASTYHEGIDITNSYGTAICASDGGTVSYAGWMGGYGYLVIIDHGNGYETYYGHNSSLLVSSGEHVYPGQQIACMGSTGVSSGDHCHFGIMKNGTFVNPLNYI